MKKYVIPALLIVTLFTSCDKSEKEVKEEIETIAIEFLGDYYYKSFDYAKNNCDKKTKAFLDYIKNNDRNQYRNQYFEKIDSVVLLNKDTALVYYRYENSFNKKDKSILPLNKQAGKWLVSIENKDNIDFYRYVFDYSNKELKVKNYLDLTAEEGVEIDLITSLFIKQVKHPKLVAGYLNKNSIQYYDIPDVENYETPSYYKTWRDLSSFDMFSAFEFSYDGVLDKFKYVISGINSNNYFAIADEIERRITNEFGTPYNSQFMEKDKWYASNKWFVKGANEILELNNNDDGTLEFFVTVCD